MRALTRAEYTEQRAVLIVERGLCMCATRPATKKPPADDAAGTPPASRPPARARKRRTGGTKAG